jgi:hypothetical protein
MTMFACVGKTYWAAADLNPTCIRFQLTRIETRENERAEKLLNFGSEFRQKLARHTMVESDYDQFGFSEV